jgi:tetratricopeptide (TPR) repeat protein
VFAKYGLAEKATEHLRAILGRAPKNITAHERLFKILLDEGDVSGARTAAAAYIAVLEEKSDFAAIDAAKNEFTARGQSFVAPSAPAKPPTVERPVPAPVIDDTDDELSFDLDAPDVDFGLSEPEMEFEDVPVAEPAAASAPEPELTFQPELIAEPDPVVEMESFELDSLELDDSVPLESLDFEEIETAAQPVLEELPPATAPEPLLDLRSDPDMAFGFDDEAPAQTAEQSSTSEPFFGLESFGDVTDEEPAIEELGEIDFYIEQELFDEARRKVDALLARFPGSADLATRRDRIIAAAAAATAAPAEPIAAPAEPQRPATLSRDEIESELLSAIPDDDDDDLTIHTPAPVAAPPPAITANPMAEANLFADEDDFFDLAAELESELNDDDENISLSEEEQSLEEIFKEFKKGVEQQLDSEDYDTHYNLGIAYKEMGLIDEAIGEFQLASKDPKRAVECASMLGLCFLEKGMPQLAIKWYRKGIEMPEILEDEHVGLLYDLGSAYVEVGDTDNAQKAFMEVYGMNSNYRDIVNRIKQLEDVRK